MPKERLRSHPTASSAGDVSAHSGGPVGPVQMCSYFMETLSQALSLPDDSERQSKYTFMKNYFQSLPEEVSSCFSAILEASRQVANVSGHLPRSVNACTMQYAAVSLQTGRECGASDAASFR